MKWEIRLFARARDLAGAERVELELPDPADVASLKAVLAEAYPGLKPLIGSLLVAVGTEYATDGQRLEPGDTIACFPPVSGG